MLVMDTPACVTSSLHEQQLVSRSEVKVLFIICKSRYGIEPSYLRDCLSQYMRRLVSKRNRKNLSTSHIGKNNGAMQMQMKEWIGEKDRRASGEKKAARGCIIE